MAQSPWWRRGDGRVIVNHRGAAYAASCDRKHATPLQKIFGEGNPLRNLLLCISVINVTFVGSARCTYWGDPPIPPVDE